MVAHFYANVSRAGGGGSGAGALQILDSHMFADASARDAYFAANPDELEEGTLIQVGEAFQMRRGNEWRDATAVVRGPRGLTGTTGSKGDAGANGWSPVLAPVEDGARIVLRVIDWAGGSGTKPATGGYLGLDGLVSTAAAAVNVRGAQGAKGDTGTAGAKGDDGKTGWTPHMAILPDGNRRVVRIIDWVGGEGTKPATGMYIGLGGLVSDVGDATDVRGAQGLAGADGVDPNHKGYYADPEALDTAFSTGEAGWFAIVGSTDTVWVWSESESAWQNTGTSGSVSSLQGLTGAVTLSGDGVEFAVVGNSVVATNTDKGSTAVAGHEAAFTHADIGTNTAARHTHANKAALDQFPSPVGQPVGRVLKTVGDDTLTFAEEEGAAGSSGYQGYFATSEQLELAKPVAVAGWYAVVGTTDTIWVWDTDSESWVDTHQAPTEFDIAELPELTELDDADQLAVFDAGETLHKRSLLSTMKAWLQNAFDSVYAAIGHDHDDSYDAFGAATGAVGAHESAYTHGDIALNTADRHVAVTQGDGITVTGQQVANADRGSIAVTAHTNDIDHSPIADVAGKVDKAGDTMTGQLDITADNAALSVTRADSGNNFIDFNRTGAGGYRFHAVSASNNVAAWRVSGPDGSNVSMRAFRTSNGFSGETWATGGGIDSQGAGIEFNHDTQDMAIYANNILARAPLHMRLNDPIYYRGDANTDGSVRISSPSASTILIEQRTDGIWEEIEIGGGIGGLDWGIYNTNQTAESGKGYLFDTSTTRTLTLPATPEEGTEIGIGDYTGQAETNNITVLRNGSNIEGQTEDLAINVDQAVFNLVYTDATVGWKIAYTNVAGDGDVVGPESSTDNAITRFDGTTGKLIQNSSATLDDSGNISVTGLQFGSGQAVDTIETTLTDDDTHIPTSGAVFDAIDGVTGVEYVSAPATPTSTGTQGQFAYSGNYLYVCVATDTWIRTSAESTWS